MSRHPRLRTRQHPQPCRSREPALAQGSQAEPKSPTSNPDHASAGPFGRMGSEELEQALRECVGILFARPMSDPLDRAAPTPVTSGDRSASATGRARVSCARRLRAGHLRPSSTLEGQPIASSGRSGDIGCRRRDDCPADERCRRLVGTARGGGGERDRRQRLVIEAGGVRQTSRGATLPRLPPPRSTRSASGAPTGCRPIPRRHPKRPA